MIKILYIVSTLKRSGPTNQLFNLVKNLDKDSFNPHLLTLSPEPDDSRWKNFKELGIKLHSLNLSRLQGLLFAKNRLTKLLADIKPDLIHTQGIRADILSSNLNIRLPRLSTIRNYPQEDYLMTYGKLQGLIMLKKHIQALKNLDLCVGVSKAVEDNLKDLFSIINTTNIPNGVDTERYFSTSSEFKNDLKNKLRIPLSAKLWVSSGHLSPRKDPLFLINVWKECFSDSSEDYLLLVGGGELEKTCRDAITRSNNILMPGRVSNVVDYLQASDYFVSSSKAEGLPNAVIEALACGLPCLLSDIGPHSEIINMDSNIGEAYTLGDKKSFINGFKNLKLKRYYDMSNASLRLVSQKLSAEVMSLNYQKCYKKLMSI